MVGPELMKSVLRSVCGMTGSGKLFHKFKICTVKGKMTVLVQHQNLVSMHYIPEQQRC